MGFKGLVDSAVSNALKTVGDLANIVSVVKHLGDEYDVESGTTIPQTQTIPNIRCVMPGFSSEEKDNEIIILTDKKGLIARADLPPDFEIEENDEIHQGTTKWDVRRILSVPGDSLYKLHLRKIR